MLWTPLWVCPLLVREFSFHYPTLCNTDLICENSILVMVVWAPISKVSFCSRVTISFHKRSVPIVHPTVLLIHTISCFCEICEELCVRELVTQFLKNICHGDFYDEYLLCRKNSCKRWSIVVLDSYHCCLLIMCSYALVEIGMVANWQQSSSTEYVTRIWKPGYCSLSVSGQCTKALLIERRRAQFC